MYHWDTARRFAKLAIFDYTDSRVHRSFLTPPIFGVINFLISRTLYIACIHSVSFSLLNSYFSGLISGEHTSPRHAVGTFVNTKTLRNSASASHKPLILIQQDGKGAKYRILLNRSASSFRFLELYHTAIFYTFITTCSLNESAGSKPIYKIGA